MNNDVAPKLTDLENAFVSCDDVEDGWKLDLCYLVEGLLLADEPKSKVNLVAWTHIRRLTLVLIKIWYITKEIIWSKFERRIKVHRLSTLYMDILLHYSIRHMR